MCGIAGIINPAGLVLDGTIERMADALQSRGPDDSGSWILPHLHLAHRRLSIIDLSEAGHQPMTSQDGRWTLVYNGEIYNAGQLRETLGVLPWRGSSDTEVLLESIARTGIADTVTRLVGMFAFAAYDAHTGELWLCRDRLGIKPLYYGWAGERFVFASELHAIRACHDQLTINPAAVATFLRLGYIPGPASIYLQIHKQPPGSLMCLNTRTARPGEPPVCRRYWDLRDHVRQDDSLDEREAQARLHDLLRTAVRDRLVADVPLGGFLSGGFDSSLVCALMQEQSVTQLNTFTIGFDDPRYNEAAHARQVAQHIGSNHHELYINERDMLEATAQLPRLCDEPFADSSILPTFLVSQMARRQVTVALSGDGGDELFWGYQRYATAEKFWRPIGLVPAPLRRLVSSTLRHPITQRMTRRIPAPGWGGRKGPLSQKLNTAGELWATPSHAALYQDLLSHWRELGQICIAAEELVTPFNDSAHWTLAYPRVQRMALQDTLTYLPDDILTKVDRASMAVSLEARVPLLDHRVVEFASGLPARLRRQPGKPKYLLKQILNSYVPAELTDRPKMGFGVPLETWLRGPLREWGEQLLTTSRIEDQGLLHAGPVQALWQAHQQGHANNAAKLWNVIMLQAWLERLR